MLVLSQLPPFHLGLQLTGVELLTLRVSLPSSFRLLWKHRHRYTQDCVFSSDAKSGQADSEDSPE